MQPSKIAKCLAVVCLLQIVTCLIIVSLLQQIHLASILSSGNKLTPGQFAPLVEPDKKQNLSKVKILCWVLSLDTSANNLKSEAVQETWGTRCDKLLIVKNGSETQINETSTSLTLALQHGEGRDQLWHKVVAVSRLLYDRYLYDYDWFFKADDDTYVRVDALRSFLTRKSSPYEPIYFGHRFKPYVRQGYMSGGSGYALSREALRRLVEIGFEQRLERCELDSGQVEDLVMGRCLEACNVSAGDTRDSRGKQTFLPLSPESLLNDQIEADHWYRAYAYYPYPRASGGKSNLLLNSSCSEQPISFHYISAREMRLIDWLLYRVKREQVE